MKKVLWIAFTIIHLYTAQAQETISFMEFNVWQEGTSVPNGLNKIRDVIIEVSNRRYYYQISGKVIV